MSKYTVKVFIPTEEEYIHDKVLRNHIKLQINNRIACSNLTHELDEWNIPFFAATIWNLAAVAPIICYAVNPNMPMVLLASIPIAPLAAAIDVWAFIHTKRTFKAVKKYIKTKKELKGFRKKYKEYIEEK